MLRIISLLLIVTPVWSNLVANFNMNNVKGTVSFSQAAVGSDVTININLNGVATGSYTLALHEFRVNYDDRDRCSDHSIGSMNKSFGTANVTSGRGALTVSGMDLSGLSSIEGRSLKFYGGPMMACATVEADGVEYITAFAKLPAGLGGTVVFRQQETSPDADTMIYTNLFFVGPVRPTTLKWQVYSGTVKMDTLTTTDVADRCGSTIGSLYNPTNAGAGCSNMKQDSCAIGALSAKHGDVSVSNMTSSRGGFIDLSLPLSGANSIVGKTLVFLNGDTVFACANIVEYPRMSAAAEISEKGVSGSVTFSQRSPLDVASVKVAISNPNNSAGSYEITKLPMPQRMNKPDAVCDMERIGDIFNPFLLNSTSASYPAPTTSTPDMYVVGDLSGKFGALKSGTTSQTYMDPNLQLFGKNSVLGRSLVFYNQQNARVFCSTIISALPLTTAVAKFTYPVIGYIILQQPTNMWYADTQIYVELDYGTQTTGTLSHNWHVHENATGSDTMADTGRCSSAAGHYNPYGVDLTGDYATHCNPYIPLRCEVGDLSKKHSQLQIRKASGGKTRYFFTDPQLPLHGPLSVIGKSITIHGENSAGSRLSCTNIEEQKPRMLGVSRWSAAAGASTPTGSITFTQHCTDLWACVSKMKVELSSLGAVSGYHVHKYPTTLETSSKDTCQNVDVGGHYNPLDGPPVGPTTGTNDMYEVGDLSGKFGGLTPPSTILETIDMNLPLEGPLSIARRSLVIHKEDKSRWACGNIEETSGTLVQAKATFMGEYMGYILLSQTRYDDGSLSPTSILVDVKRKDGTVTAGHKWHVHELRHAAGDTTCSSAKDHYNPYKVDMSNAGYQECKMSNPLRCEVGDQSSKLGLYDIGSGKAFYTDVNLDLEGQISAAKRSIVIHGMNMAGERIACANLMPYGSSKLTYEYSFPRVEYDSQELETQIALAIKESERDILSVEKMVGSRCITVDLYFIGPRKTTIHNELKDLIASGNYNQLGKFKPGDICGTNSAGLAQISTTIMLASVLLAILGLRR